jgi:NAD(P)-dependent dehydrogenase (short-subunit alcohol dehydrogenase family)
MNVNFRAPFILIRNFANMLRSGIIVNFTDSRIVTNKSDFAAYSIAKKALWELTKMAALEFGPEIRVNAIAPGLSLPPEEKGEEYLWKLAEKVAMKRPGGLEPILKSLDYILGNDYLTGQLLFCDGGENLGSTK